MSGCFPVSGLWCLSRDEGMAAHGAPRFLLTFGIVDENSGDSVLRTVPGQQLQESLRATDCEGFYNEHMQRVFKYLGKQGVRSRDLRAIYEAIPLLPGTCFEVILISDANTFGLESTQRATGHHSLFLRILSNSSGSDAQGLLALWPFHTHSCVCCPANMCKHKVLSDYLRERAHDGMHFDYPIHRLIPEAQKAEPSSFCARVVPWETDVRLHLQQVLKSC
uniref:Uncharacterized protein n=1 Tax=Pan troglodytes TaxID=9598 RepID=A0A2I3SEJ9_PANTR